MFIPSDPVQYKVHRYQTLSLFHNQIWAFTASPLFEHILTKTQRVPLIEYFQIWAFVTSPFFEYLIFAAICINTVLLAMGFYNQVLYLDHQLFHLLFFVNYCHGEKGNILNNIPTSSNQI